MMDGSVRGQAGRVLTLALAAIFVLCFDRAGVVGQSNDTVAVEVSTIGIDGRTGTPIVVLRDPESGGVLPVWIGPNEAQAIALVLHGIVPPRPMTHDLMAS